ncbi:MAG: tRNA-dihydrouridine synthase family protein [Muribaculaceae bacterium]|nr:tRNA-dihydrouridine synthase family protein [Muribaculaceae bacterium]
MPKLSFVAPLQGYTDVAYRHYHAKVYGNVADAYISPFLRVEHNEVRKRDINDITSPLGNNHRLIPQIVAGGADEFNLILNTILQAGYKEVNLNLGCPFPPQLKHGRGAALLLNAGEMARIADIMLENPDIKFSAKMRLGISMPDEWQQSITAINRMPLEHITVHPRTAAQQYKGEIYFDEFRLIMQVINHPVIYNGELKTIEDIKKIYSDFPEICGIMIGRGLLANPALLNEWTEGVNWSVNKRMEAIMSLHEGIYTHYCNTLCGEAQILSKIKPFWEYLIDSIDKRTAKLIKKATSVAKYNEAVGRIR